MIVVVWAENILNVKAAAAGRQVFEIRFSADSNRVVIKPKQKGK